jgi:hypothetical protein
LLLAEPVLLDGLLQAAVLGQGDVVAVRSAAPPLPTFFGCFDHHMAINPQNIHRPVLAAVMQVGYPLLARITDTIAELFRAQCSSTNICGTPDGVPPWHQTRPAHLNRILPQCGNMFDRKSAPLARVSVAHTCMPALVL